MDQDIAAALHVSVRDDAGLHEIRALEGVTLLEALRAANIAIGGICGGGMMCGTCHVFLSSEIARALDAPCELETMLLESSAFYDPERSRLACQVPTSATLGGLIEVAPDD